MQYTFNISQNAKQQQVLSLFQQQSLQVLSMDVQGVCRMLFSEQESNPVLDIPPHILDVACTYSRGFISFEDSAEAQYAVYDFTSLRDSLRAQVNTHMQKGSHGKTVEAIISCIDEETGFLCCDVHKIKKALPDVSSHCFEEALSHVRSLAPYGVGTQNIKEFLLWQLDQQGIDNSLCQQIIRNHLDALAHRHLREIARACGAQTRCVDEARRLIGSMRPYPAFGYSNCPVHYIIPDIFVNVENGQLSILINDNWMRYVSLNPDYIQYLQNAEDPVLRAYLQERLDRATNIRSQIEQRKNTLQRLCDYVFSIQKDYFLKNTPLTPLSGSDIAKALYMTPSTISRCLHEKYVHTPKGTFPLNFFVASTSKSPTQFNELRITYLDAAILALLKQEDPSAPYSDQQIATLLSSQGYSLSRRTVAKYRNRLGINNACLRKL